MDSVLSAGAFSSLPIWEAMIPAAAAAAVQGQTPVRYFRPTR